MQTRTDLPLTARTLTALVLTLLLVLVVQAWASLRLRELVSHPALAEDVPRLVGLPLLFLLAWLLIRRDRQQPERLFLRLPPARLVVAALAVGVLARVAEWAQLTARGAFGWVPAAANARPAEFSANWDCPAAPVLVASGLVYCCLIPITEEFVHRGAIQGALAHRGPWIAIVTSAAFFAVCHPPSAFISVFALGTLFGIQYWNTGILWCPIISHAVYDGFIPFDVLCLKLAWNPPPDALPVLIPGVTASVIFACCVAAAICLVTRMRAEPRPAQPA